MIPANPLLELALVGALLVEPTLLEPHELDADDVYHPRIRAVLVELRAGAPITDLDTASDCVAGCWLPLRRDAVLAAAAHIARLAERRRQILANGEAALAAWTRAEREALNFTDEQRPPEPRVPYQRAIDDDRAYQVSE